MPHFSSSSLSKLYTCDSRIEKVFCEVIKHFDCIILEGHRDQDRQNELRAAGKSQLVWPNSKHNSNPSLAIDVAPYPIDWKDRERFSYFAGFVIGIAKSLKVELKWGGDWDGDWQVRDNHFDDLCHFEIVD